MKYTFLEYDPSLAYRTNYLMVPKALMGEAELTKLRDNTLTLQVSVGRGGGFVTHRLWRESEHHLFIPREFPWEGPAPVVIEPEYTQVLFDDRRRDFLDNEQRQAWGAFEAADCGILNLSCVAGDTKVTLNRGGASKTVSIEYAWRCMHRRERQWSQQRDPNTQTRIRAFLGNRIGLHTLLDVAQQGVRPTWVLRLATGQELCLTEDHEVLTVDGFQSIEHGLKVGGLAITDGAAPRGIRVTALIKGPRTMVYDLVCAAPHHNFVANGIVVHNCGRGKSWLACKKIAQRGLPAIIIVTNTGAIPEWEREIHGSIWRGKIGRIQGRHFDWEQPVVISTIQTLMSRADTLPEQVRRYYGTVIYDEVHRTSADRFKRTASIFWGARYGLSATVDRPDQTQDIYFWHIGPVFHSDLYQELVPRIYFLRLSTACPDMGLWYDRGGELSVSLMYEWLLTHPIRNRQIAATILKCLANDRHILVLGHSVPGLYALQKTVEVGTVITKDTPQARRTAIIRESKVTFATPALAKESLNVPSLDTVIFVTSFRDWNTLQQGMGRALRRYGNKNHPLVLIMEDVGIGPCYGFCQALRQGLKEHGYEYDVTSAG